MCRPPHAAIAAYQKKKSMVQAMFQQGAPTEQPPAPPSFPPQEVTPPSSLNVNPSQDTTPRIQVPQATLPPEPLVLPAADEPLDAEAKPSVKAAPCDEKSMLMKYKRRHRSEEMLLEEIEDPAERRRQKRLMKNRLTAAISRERKKHQVSQLQAQVQTAQEEAAGLRRAVVERDMEISELRQEVAGLRRVVAQIQNAFASAPAPGDAMGSWAGPDARCNNTMQGVSQPLGAPYPTPCGSAGQSVGSDTARLDPGHLCAQQHQQPPPPPLPQEFVAPVEEPPALPVAALPTDLPTDFSEEVMADLSRDFHCWQELVL
ncbi:unnamed protein product [Pedinophyceae sp. YPF-701]|nr:unnamed protein product [Pedinophyceae sp. YPF-701]